MFIPNKTYHAMRVGILSVIAGLLVVIAGQTVLYTQLEKETHAMIDSLETKIAKLDKETDAKYYDIDGEQTGLGQLLQETITKVDAQALSIGQLQEFTSKTQGSVDKLLRNECTPETAIYVLTKDMVAVCRSLGVVP